MLRRRAEGYEWTLGRNRHAGEPSWPEKFFTEVIDNEFLDKNVVTELQMGRYSLDFAWPEKKKCIEIDGEQHYTQPSQAKSDLRKNKYLKSQGWEVLRIRWRDMFSDTKANIQKANKFIGP
jgi:very-short-patch-repair endonuclease